MPVFTLGPSLSYFQFRVHFYFQFRESFIDISTYSQESRHEPECFQTLGKGLLKGYLSHWVLHFRHLAWT